MPTFSHSFSSLFSLLSPLFFLLLPMFVQLLLASIFFSFRTVSIFCTMFLCFFYNVHVKATVFCMFLVFSLSTVSPCLSLCLPVCGSAHSPAPSRTPAIHHPSPLQYIYPRSSARWLIHSDAVLGRSVTVYTTVFFVLFEYLFSHRVFLVPLGSLLSGLFPASQPRSPPHHTHFNQPRSLPGPPAHLCPALPSSVQLSSAVPFISHPSATAALPQLPSIPTVSTINPFT